MAVSVCPECQKSIPPSAPAGQCPACLLKRGLERAGFASAAFAVTTPQGSKQIPLTPEVIAPSFPQLEILELLGQGGMGTVFKARQLKLDRLVAVKIIRPETAADHAFAERFMREAKTLARLNHPSIVSVHDFGEVTLTDSKSGAVTSGPTLFFFIMEYVEGANLRQLMQSAPISPPLTLGIIQQVCEALQYAHEEGVVHRDIKPENIMLDSKGRVKIADFGLAKLADQSGEEWTLTGTHQVMGTPRYMAPEQLAGARHVDHRVDIYSLAVVFYEMLTGTIPVGHFAPPSKKAAVGVRYDEVILKAMASDPGERFQSVREFRSGVDRIVAGAGEEEHPRGSDDLPGVSTILDRQVAGAWRLLTGRQPQKSENLNAASLTATPHIGISLVGIAGLLITVFANPTESSKSDFVLRILSVCGFAMIAFLWIAMPVRLRNSAWAALGSLLLSVLTFVAVMVGLSVSYAGGAAFDRLYLIPFACAISLMMLSIAGLRRVLVDPTPQTRVLRTDTVIVTRQQLEQGILPDICMISGEPTYNRVTYSMKYHLAWSEAIHLAGRSASGIPSALMNMISQQTLHIACPLCHNHAGHWRNLKVFASLAWMMIPLMGLAGFMIGFQYPDAPGERPRIAGMTLGMTLGLALAITGLVAYLVPIIWMSWHRVKVDQAVDASTPTTQISLGRVCQPFAAEVRRRQALIREQSSAT